MSATTKMSADAMIAAHRHAPAQAACEGWLWSWLALPTRTATIAPVTHSSPEQIAASQRPQPTWATWGTLNISLEKDVTVEMLTKAMARHPIPTTSTPHATGTAHRRLKLVLPQLTWTNRAIAERAPRIRLTTPQLPGKSMPPTLNGPRDNYSDARDDRRNHIREIKRCRAERRGRRRVVHGWVGPWWRPPRHPTWLLGEVHILWTVSWPCHTHRPPQSDIRQIPSADPEPGKRS
jgi:hypothetical protein